MMRRTFGSLLVMLLVTFALSSSAFAQDSASVIILKFETFETSDVVVKEFYKQLQRGVEDHEDLNVQSGGEVTIDELILTAGCDEPNEKCLASLRDFVGADKLVFGAIQQSDDVFLFTIRSFDFAEGRFTREVVDQTIQGDVDAVKAATPAIVDNFLYGSVGTLEITLAGEKSAEILFNGEKMGFAPTTLENLPLGEHSVTLRTESGEERTENIVLRHNEPGVLNFSFDAEADDPEPVAGGPSTAPGWILLGVGVAAVGVGVYGTMAESGVNDDFDALCAKPGNVCEGANASLANPADAAEAKDLTDQGGTAKTMQLIGYSVGGVAVVAGGFMLWRAMSAAPESEDDGAVSFSAVPTRDGFEAGMMFQF